MIRLASMEKVAKLMKIELTQQENDLMAVTMYKEERDAGKLCYSALINFLEGLGCKKGEISAAEPKDVMNIKGVEDAGKEPAALIPVEEKTAPARESPPKMAKGGEDYEDNYEENFEKEEEPRKVEAKEEEVPIAPIEAEAPVSEPVEKKEGEDEYDEDFADINEDQMLEIAQKCFFVIADTMLQKKTTAKKLYTEAIQKQKLNGEEVEVISAEDFIKGVQMLGIEEFKAIEYACLIKVLAANEEEKYVKLSDLILILEDYGVRDVAEKAAASSPPKEGKKEQKKEQKEEHQQLNLEELDQLSMVLMLALTEYLIKSNIPLYDLFGEAIYQQVVKTKTKQKNVEIINSNDFFDVLHKIGIQTEESEHDNLKKFLCLGTHYGDKLSIKKLKKIIEEFAFNEELRKYAHQCYEALIADNPDDDKGELEGE